MGPVGRDHSGNSGRYGLVGRQASVVADAVAALVEGFEPDTVGARDAMDLVDVFTRVEHIASAGRLLAARRVAQTELWRKKGHRSPAHWLSHVTGVSVAEAVTMLATAEVVETAPDTREALKEGRVSTRQAKAIGAAENADPDAGRRLLESASRRSTAETENDSARIVAAASGEDPGEKAARHRRQRKIWHAVDADGMGIGGWRLPMAEHTRFVAGLEAEQAKVFHHARTAGKREPAHAYAADAFCRLFERAFDASQPAASAGDDAADHRPTSPRSGDDWSFAKVIVRADLGALDRGTVAPGEVCEVAGQGPISVDDAWRIIDGGAFIAAISTRGSEIAKVVHLGRRPTVLQRTALEWATAGTCAIEGCDSTARLEIDHVADWAATERTELAELAPVCGHHHDLKTHRGHTFGPVQPNGKRQLIPPPDTGPPPDASGPPDSTGPPDGTAPPGRRPPDGTAPPGGRPPDGTGPPDLELVPTDDTPGNETSGDDTTSPPGRTTDHAPSRKAPTSGPAQQGGLFDTG